MALIASINGNNGSILFPHVAQRPRNTTYPSTGTSAKTGTRSPHSAQCDRLAPKTGALRALRETQVARKLPIASAATNEIAP
nr:hypothetical protein [Nisaea sediminum]